MRQKLVAGNWKMNGGLSTNLQLLQEVVSGVGALNDVGVAVCVPFPYLAQAQSALTGTAVAWGAQNGYNVSFLTVAGCPMLLGEVSFESRIDATQTAPCNRALPFFAKAMAANPKVRAILFAQRFDLFDNGIGFANTSQVIFFRDGQGNIVPDHHAYYRHQLGFTVDTLRELGKKVVLLKQVPLLGSISDCEWEPRLKQLLGVTRADLRERLIGRYDLPGDP